MQQHFRKKWTIKFPKLSMQKLHICRHSEKKTKKNNGKKKKRIYAAVFVAGIFGIAAILSGIAGSGNKDAVIDLSDTTILSYRDIQDSISATGIVESAQSTMVYSTLSNSVKAIHVEVGDSVQEGQLLAELDDESIQNQISSQEISMETAAKSSEEQIKSAQDNYDNYKYGLDNGLNSSLLTAQSQVDTAYEAYEDAVSTYERYEDGLDDGENTTLINAEESLRKAENAVKSAQETLDAAEKSYRDTCSAYDNAKAELDKESSTLDSLKKEKESIQKQLEELKTQSQTDEIQSNELQNKQNQTEESIQSLQTQLDTMQVSEAAELTDEERAEIQELENEISALGMERAALEEQIAQASENSLNNTDVEQLEAKLAEKEQQITQQETVVSQLKSTVEQAESAMKTAETQVSSAKSALSDASGSYDSASASYDASVTSTDDMLEDYEDNVESAWNSYQDALTSLESTKKSTQDQLQTYENSLSSAKTSADNSSGRETLRQLTVELEDTKITAPASGTVTAVYAEVGSGGSGLLFVIEDTENLIVDTSIQGYDIGKVQIGTKVSISADGIEEKEMEGTITDVAPTANKTSQGVTDTSTDAVFSAEVGITTHDTGLKIGMEAQLDYIVSEETHILAVPYDAVYKNEQGETCVIVAAEQKNGKYLLQEMKVKTGMDDDLDMVISGTGIEEGLCVLNEPDSYRMLIGKTVSAGILRDDSESSGMGPMGPLN